MSQMPILPRPLRKTDDEAAGDQSPTAALAGSDASPVLSYATAARTIKAMSLRGARVVLWLSFAPAFIGLLILTLYRLTASDTLPGAGLCWLFAGGAMTVVLGIISLTNFVRATSRKPREAVAWHYGWAVPAGLLNLAAAFVCVKLGAAWTEAPHTHVRVVNTTSTPLDRVVVHLDSGNITVNGIAPHASRSSWLAWPHHQSGSLNITVTARGQSRDKQERPHVGLWDLKADPFVVTIEQDELPKALAGSHP